MKSELLRLLQQEIRRHDFSYFISRFRFLFTHLVWPFSKVP